MIGSPASLDTNIYQHILDWLVSVDIYQIFKLILASTHTCTCTSVHVCILKEKLSIIEAFCHHQGSKCEIPGKFKLHLHIVSHDTKHTYAMYMYKVFYWRPAFYRSITVRCAGFKVIIHDNSLMISFILIL